MANFNPFKHVDVDSVAGNELPKEFTPIEPEAEPVNPIEPEVESITLGAVSEANVKAINAYITSYGFIGLTKEASAYLWEDLKSYDAATNPAPYDNLVWSIPAGAGTERESIIAYINSHLS